MSPKYLTVAKLDHAKREILAARSCDISAVAAQQAIKAIHD